MRVCTTRTAGLPPTAINLCPQDLIVVRRVAIQVHGHKLCGRACVHSKVLWCTSPSHRHFGTGAKSAGERTT